MTDTITYAATQTADDTERGALSAVLNGGRETLQAVLAEGVDASDYRLERYRLIFGAMTALHDAGAEIDVIGVVDRLRVTGELAKAGGAAAVSQLEAAVVSPSLAVTHARRLRDRAALRRCSEAARGIIEDASQPDAVAEVVRQRGLDALQAVYTAAESHTVDPHEALEAVWHDIENPEQARGIPTGYDAADAMTGGLQAGALWILAARPSMGKTALALNIAVNAAEYGAAVGVISLEMSAKQLYRRALSSVSGVALPPGRRSFSSAELRELVTAKGHLAEIALAVDERPGQTADTILASIAALCADGADLIVIDYLGLISAGSAGAQYRGNKALEVAEITKSLKQAAREHEVPILLLAQLNRGVEGRNDKRPMMSDLRDSGAIEQDADVISFLYREEYYQKEKTDPAFIGVGEWLIAKNRQGPTGRVWLRWFGERSLFRSLETEDLPQL